MHHSTIGSDEGTGKALCDEIIDRCCDVLADGGSFAGQGTKSRAGADGVQPEPRPNQIGGDAEHARSIGKGMCRVAPARAAIERDVDSGIEIDALQDFGEGFGSGGQAKAVGTDGLLENECQAGRAILEIVQRLLVCAHGIGIIDALQDRPRRCSGAGENGCAGTGHLIERLDPDAVGGAGDELFVEVRAFEHGVDTIPPDPFVGYGRFVIEWQMSHGHTPPSAFQG